MNEKYTALPGGEDRIVYIREVAVADLPAEIQAQAEGLDTIWSVHRPDGMRVALVRDKDMAFALSRQHEMVPVSVH
jgi:hypothetical protein